MNAAALGRRLAALRREAGLSQAELAERMGTTQAAISKIESGRNLPTLTVLDRFARATGRSFELPFGGPAEKTKRSQMRNRVRAALDGYSFDPWERNPTPTEAKSLKADGLTRERFTSRQISSASRRRKQPA